MKRLKRFEDFEISNENIYIPEIERTPVLKGTSFEIKYPVNEFHVGEKIRVSQYAEKYPKKRGIIAPPTNMGNKTDSLKIDFSDGSTGYVPITHISRDNTFEPDISN